MIRKLYFFMLAVSLLPLTSLAATLKGHIADSKGEALPFATVYIQGTTIGTSANVNGEYQLTLEPGKYKVICQYIGYKQSAFNADLTSNTALVHNFTLEDQSLEIKEFVVHASEDPGVYIMKKAIARRAFHLGQLKSFQTDIYLKGVFRTRTTPKKVLGEKVDNGDIGVDTNGKGVLYLCEEEASYYTRGNKERTVIHSVRESGDPGGFGFSQFPSVINFYENNVQILERLNPRGFISPVNDFALNYYKFKLEGEFQEGGHTIYKISVKPKRLYEPLFTGTIYIVDEDWAIHSLNMLVTKTSSLEIADTVRLEQVYLPLKPDTWVSKQQVLYLTLKIFGFDLSGYLATVYNGQKVNEPIADTIFNDKIVSVYDKQANKKDTSYWTNTRPVPLEADESRDYILKDSIRLRREDPAYIDSMRRKDNKFGPMNLVLYGVTHNTKRYKHTITTNALLTGMVNYNTIEGVNVAPKVWWKYNADTNKYVTGVFAARYGFGNKHFNGIGRVFYTRLSDDWKGRFRQIGIEAGKYVFQFNPNNPINELPNTISTLFYRKNYLKLYERWNAALLYNRSLGNGLKWEAKLGFQQRIPLDNNTDYSFAKSNTGGFTENIPPELKPQLWEKHNAVIARVKLSYQPGYTYTLYPDYRMPHPGDWPVFSLSYEKGIPNVLNSKVDFDKWRVGVRDEIGLRLVGSFSYNIAAGGFLNDKYVSLPDLMHLNGNQLTLASTYLESFQLAPYYLFSNKEPLYGEAHIEYSLKGFLTNKIPLFRQMRWYLVTGANAFYANADRYHAEAFVGIDNFGYDKFRVFRIDYVQSWNGFNQRSSGIRIGISTASIIRISLGDSSGEW